MRILLFLCFILGCFSVKAQGFKVNWSDSQKKSKEIAALNIIGIEGEHYYYLETIKKKAIITKCDKNHQKVEEQILSIDYDKGIKKFSEVINTKSGQYLYFVNWNRRNKTFQLLTSTFEDGKAGEIKKIHEHSFNTKEYLPLYLNENMVKMRDCIDRIVVSSEKNYVGFVNSYSLNDVNPAATNRDRKDPDKMELVVFDDKMNKAWSKTQVFDYPDRAITIHQADVDNQGNLYLLARLTEYAEPKSKEGEYKVFVISQNDFKSFDIQLEDNFIPESVKINATNKKDTDFVITGFYGKKNTKNDYQGFLYIEGNKNNGVSKTRLNSLDDIHSKFSISTEKSKKEKKYNISENIFFEDGTIGVIVNIIVEYDYLKTASKGRIVISLSKEGEIKAYQKINSSGDVEALIHIKNDNIYLIFDNLATKKELRKSKKKSIRSVQATDLVVISKEGKKILNKRLFTGADKDMHFRRYLSATNIRGLNDGTILLGCWDVNKFAFGLIEF